MARKIPKEIYDAYLKWLKKEKEAEKIHDEMAKLIQKKLKIKADDRIEQGQVIVQLERVRLGTMDLTGKLVGKE
jgi:hypothetical protein